MSPSPDATKPLPRGFLVLLLVVCCVITPLATTSIMAGGYAVLDRFLGGSPDISWKSYLGFVLPYSLPLMLIVGPLMARFYIKTTGHAPLTLETALKAGLKFGTAPFLALAALFGIFALLYSISPVKPYPELLGIAPVLCIVCAVFALFGLLLGPPLAVCFGAILRKLDPRYPSV